MGTLRQLLTRKILRSGFAYALNDKKESGVARQQAIVLIPPPQKSETNSGPYFFSSHFFHTPGARRLIRVPIRRRSAMPR